jgi:hypothetical protein
MKEPHTIQWHLTDPDLECYNMQIKEGTLVFPYGISTLGRVFAQRLKCTAAHCECRCTILGNDRDKDLQRWANQPRAADEPKCPSECKHFFVPPNGAGTRKLEPEENHDTEEKRGNRGKDWDSCVRELNRKMKELFMCYNSRLRGEPNTGAVPTRDDPVETRTRENQQKRQGLCAMVLNTEVHKPLTFDGKNRARGEPNSGADSTGDVGGGLQTAQKQRNRKKHKKQDLRVKVLKRNLRKSVLSDWNTGVAREPISVGASAKVSDWATDADNYLRALFLPNRPNWDSKPDTGAYRQYLGPRGILGRGLY